MIDEAGLIILSVHTQLQRILQEDNWSPCSRCTTEMILEGVVA